MGMPVTGMLREGSMFQNSLTVDFLFANCSFLDGIHIDMDHLKHGEVKYFSLFPNSEITTNPSIFSQSRDLNVPNSPRNARPLPQPLISLSRMAITFSDGVILGADSRTTTGAYIANRVTDKLTQVHDTIWCCRSGSAADTQAVADIVHYHLGMYGITNEQPPTTQTAAALFQELCYDNKDQLR